MALIPSLTLVTASTNQDQITVQEDTGDYNVTTNPGGYGTPNPAATDVAQYVVAIKRNYVDDDVNWTSLIDNTGAENDSTTKTWTLDVSEETGAGTLDGWYSFWLIVADRYSAVATYGVDDLVSSSGILYKSLQAANTGNTPASSPTWWTAIDLETITVAGIDAIGDSPSSYSAYSAELNDILVENTEIYYANRVAEYSTEADGYADITEEMKELAYLEFFMRAAYANEAKENWTAAEKNIQILKDIQTGKVKTIL